MIEIVTLCHVCQNKLETYSGYDDMKDMIIVCVYPCQKCAAQPQNALDPAMPEVSSATNETPGK